MLIIIINLIILINFPSSKSTPVLIPAEDAETVCLSPEEIALYKSINDYRKQKKLPPIALSAALTKVAKAHAKDLMENYDLEQRDKCNPHSWSDKGPWTACCYDNRHKDPNCMWDKPKEIAGYPAAGYENVFWNSNKATPAGALEGWKKSPGHNQVMVNLDIWKKVTWKALGVAIHEQYAIAWFGDVVDEKEIPTLCK